MVFGSALQFIFICGITTRWMYLPELYPTSIRTFGTGLTWMAALVGAAILPLVLGYVFKAYGGPGVLSVAALMLAIIAVTMGFFAVETRGRRLETLAADS